MTSFSQNERAVIRLAAHPRERLPMPGTFALWCRRMFGTPLPIPLADPRLEALRRFAAQVQDERLSTISEPMIHAFVTSGWKRTDADRLMAYLQIDRHECGGRA